MERCIFYPEVALDTSFSHLRQCIESALDSESLRMYELRFETLTENKTPEIVLQEFHQLINNTDKLIFRKLQKEYAHDIQKLSTLLVKAKEK